MPNRLLERVWQQYAFAVLAFTAVSLLNLWLENWTGYEAIALVYLLAVMLLAMFVSRGPILLGTALTALGWNYLFAPPRYSFHIGSFYDKMMLGMYFVVALTVGQLTARLREHRQLELQRELLAESEKLGRTLLNSVSHELRTPLAAITSAADSLQATVALTPIQQRLIGEIEMASARLNRVVQSLLSAARLQSGHLRPKLDWCDIGDVLRAALQSTDPLVSGHPITKNLEADLPLIKADFVLTEQAVANLLTNVASHTPARTPIEIVARVEGNELKVQVADRGPGLSREQLERPFDWFHRPEGAQPGGTGLGLAIVKGFVEAQGGRVRAGNRLGGGAVFEISMPLPEPPQVSQEPS